MATAKRKPHDGIGSILKVFTAIVVAALYLLIVVLVAFSFNDNPVTTLPLRGFTLDWYRRVFANDDMLQATLNSFKVGIAATVITLVIGTSAAFAIDRTDFPGNSFSGVLCCCHSYFLASLRAFQC